MLLQKAGRVENSNLQFRGLGIVSCGKLNMAPYAIRLKCGPNKKPVFEHAGSYDSYACLIIFAYELWTQMNEHSTFWNWLDRVCDESGDCSSACGGWASRICHLMVNFPVHAEIPQLVIEFPQDIMKYPHIFMVKVQFPIWWLNKFNFWTAPEHSNLAPGRTIAMWTSMCPLGVLSAFAVRAVSLVLGHSDVRLSSLAPVQPGGGKILKWTDPRLRSWVFVTRHPGGIIFFPVWSWWKMSCPESWKSAVL